VRAYESTVTAWKLTRCQWTGLPLAQAILDLGWFTPTHFISHDPRMRHDAHFGPYMIATGLPMRYLDPVGGLLALWHMPAQWDESQTLGDERLVQRPPDDWPGWQTVPPAYHGFYDAMQPDRAQGMVRLSPEAFGAELAAFAREAATRWHGVQICNFHPLYVAGPQDHPRASRRALELGLDGARDAGCRFENLENWSRFFRARATVTLEHFATVPGAAHLVLRAEQDLNDLFLLLPESVGIVSRVDTGASLPIVSRTLEGRAQPGVVCALRAGKPLELRLALNG
jgi:hypothetical protein